MILRNYNWNFVNCLPSSFCDNVIAYGNTKRQISAGIAGESLTTKENLSDKDLHVRRKSNVAWLNDWWIYRHLKPLVSIANTNAGWNFETHMHEAIQFTKYVDNGHYDYHADMHEAPHNSLHIPEYIGKVRKLSMTVPLVDGSEYEGGDFVIQTPGGVEVVIKEARQKGAVIVFPSFVQHKVTPVTSGTRYSLVMWTLGWPFK